MATKTKKPAAKTVKKAAKPKAAAKKTAPKKVAAPKVSAKAKPKTAATVAKPVQSQPPVAAQPAAAPMACEACDCSRKKCGKCGKVILVLAAIIAAIALACYVWCPKVREAAPALVGTQWGLVDLSGKAPAENGRFSLLLDAEGQISGQSGCNRYSGRYELTGEKLKIASPLVGTRMACPGDAMKQENEFLDILSSAEQLGIQDDGRLFIWGAKGRILIFAAQQPQE